jgi:hypothetical protein
MLGHRPKPEAERHPRRCGGSHQAFMRGIGRLRVFGKGRTHRHRCAARTRAVVAQPHVRVRTADQDQRLGGDRRQHLFDRVGGIDRRRRGRQPLGAQDVPLLLAQHLDLACLGREPRHCIVQLAPVFPCLDDPQRLGLEPHLLLSAMEIDEHADLGPQNFGHHRRLDVVDRSECVAARRMVVDVGGRGDEDDRRVGRPRPPADQRCQLETVQLRHVDVEQHQREVAPEQQAQCIRTRRRLEHDDRQIGKRRLERQPLVGPVVHDQDLGRWDRQRFGARPDDADISWSAISAASAGVARGRPAWRCSRTHRLRRTARDPPSSPWR